MEVEGEDTGWYRDWNWKGERGDTGARDFELVQSEDRE